MSGLQVAILVEKEHVEDFPSGENGTEETTYATNALDQVGLLILEDDSVVEREL